MTAAAPQGDSFAEAFDVALRLRSASLSWLRMRLTEAGVIVSASTLNYWRIGERHPEGGRSLRAVSAIEDVLDLSPGSLTRHVIGRSSRVGAVSEQAPAFETDPDYRELYAALGVTPPAKTRVVSMEEIIDVDGRGSVSSVRELMLLQCVEDAVESVGFVLTAPAPTSVRPVFTVDGGGVPAPVLAHANGRMFGFAITLDRTIRRGETAMVCLTVGFPDEYPIRRRHLSGSRRPLREFIQWYRFTPGYVPDWFDEVELTAGARKVASPALSAPASLHRVRWNFGPGAVDLSWGFDEDPLSDA